MLSRPGTVVRLSLALALALGSGTAAYTVIAAADLNPAGSGDERVALAVNTYVNDVDVTITNAEIAVVPGTVSAAGTSAPGVEATLNSAAGANAALVAGNYSYRFVVRESGATAWTAGENFRIRLYGNDVSIPQSTLLATLYVKQVVQDDGGVEGVTVTFDLGSATGIQDDFSIIVDRQAEM